jgi:DNA-directed RNA polymerase specialized sigma24 family protein
MTPSNGDGAQHSEERPLEERAEELMRRLSGDVSRFLVRFSGRAREEIEDVVAEARTVKDRWERR